MTVTLDQERTRSTSSKAGKRALRAALGSTVGLMAGGIVLMIAMVIMIVVVTTGGGNDNQPSPTGPIAGVSAPTGADVRLRNAIAILNVARQRGLGDGAGQIGIAVAIAESSLLNYANDGTSSQRGDFDDGHRQLNDAERAVAKQSLAYPHDAVGHDLDSMGLFQQRPSAGWGDPKDLMDPTISAGKFFDALARVDGWKNLDPWVAAQTVQGSPSSNGGIYRDAWDQAGQELRTILALPGATSGTITAPQGPVGSPAVVSGGDNTVSLPANAGLSGVISAPTPRVARALAAGLGQIGVPYSWGGGTEAGPTVGICGPNGAENDCHITGFDCSGLMRWMWGQVGIHLPPISDQQRAAATPVPYEQRQPGDMLGYNGHIAVYLGTFNGVDMQLEAPYSGQYVRVSKVAASHFDQVYRVWEGR